MLRESNILYVIGKESCSKCHTIKDILDKREIPHIYIDLYESDDKEYLKQRIDKENNGLVPMLILNGKVVSFQDVLNKEK